MEGQQSIYAGKLTLTEEEVMVILIALESTSTAIRKNKGRITEGIDDEKARQIIDMADVADSAALKLSTLTGVALEQAAKKN